MNLKEYEAYLRSLGLPEEEIQRLLEEARLFFGEKSRPDYATPTVTQQADEIGDYIRAISANLTPEGQQASGKPSLTEKLALESEYRQIYDQLKQQGVEAEPPRDELGVEPADLKRLAKQLGWSGEEMARWAGMLYGTGPIPSDAELFRMARGSAISGTDLAYLVSEIQRRREEQQPTAGPLEALTGGFARGVAESVGTAAVGLDTLRKLLGPLSPDPAAAAMAEVDKLLGNEPGKEIQASLEAGVPAPKIDETSLLSQVAKMVGETAGQMAPTVVPGLLAAPAGAALSAGAAFAGALLPNIGESSQTLEEKWGIDDPLLAVTAGALKSVLDTAAFEKGIGKAAEAGAAKVLPKLVEALKADQPVARSIGKLIAKGVFDATRRQAESAAWEATTEVLQDLIDRAAGAIATGDWEKFQENIWSEMSDTFTKVALGTFFGFAPVGAAKAAVGAVATSKGWLAGEPASVAAEALAQSEADGWELAAKAAVQAAKEAKGAPNPHEEERLSLPGALQEETQFFRERTTSQQSDAEAQEQAAKPAIEVFATFGEEPQRVNLPSFAYLSKAPITAQDIPTNSGYSAVEQLPEDPAEVGAASYYVLSLPNRTAASSFLRKLAEIYAELQSDRPALEDGSHPVVIAGQKTIVLPAGPRDSIFVMHLATTLGASRLIVDRKAGSVSFYVSSPVLDVANTFSEAMALSTKAEERLNDGFRIPAKVFKLPRFLGGEGALSTLEALGVTYEDLITAWAVTHADEPAPRPIQVADLTVRVARALRSLGDRLGIKWIPFTPPGGTRFHGRLHRFYTVSGEKAAVVELPLGVGSVLTSAAHEVAHKLVDINPSLLQSLAALGEAIDPEIRRKAGELYPGTSERGLTEEVAAETLQELASNKELARAFQAMVGDKDARQIFLDLFRLGRYAELELARRVGRAPKLGSQRITETWFGSRNQPQQELLRTAAEAFEQAVSEAVAATPKSFSATTLSELLLDEAKFRRKLTDLSASAAEAHKQLAPGKLPLGQTAALAAYHAIASGGQVAEEHQAILATFRPETWPTGVDLVARDEASTAEAARIFEELATETEKSGDRFTATGARVAARIAKRGVVFHAGDRARPIPLGMPVWVTGPQDAAFLLGNVAAAAAAGATQRHWYTNQGAAIAMLAGDGDPKHVAERVRRIAYALAATSPRASSEDNLRAVGALLHAAGKEAAAGAEAENAIIKAARETAKKFWGKDIAVFEASLRQAARALRGEWVPDPSTPKIYAFSQHLISGAKRALEKAGRGDIAAELQPDLSLPVVDSWIYRAFGVEPEVSKPTDNHYGQAAAALRELAEITGQDTGELQAAIWGAISTASGRIRSLLGEKAEALFAAKAKAPLPARSRETAELYREAFERLAAESPIISNGGYFEHLLRDVEMAVVGETTPAATRQPVMALVNRSAPGRRKAVLFGRGAIAVAIEGESTADEQLGRRISAATGGEVVLLRIREVSEPTDVRKLDAASLPELASDEVPLIVVPAASSVSAAALLSEIEKRLDGPARAYAQARGETEGTLNVLARLPGVSWIVSGPVEAPREVLEDWRKAAIEAAKEVFGEKEIVPVTAGIATRTFVDVARRAPKAKRSRAEEPGERARGEAEQLAPQMAQASEEMVRTATEEAAQAQVDAEKAVELMRAWEKATRRFRAAVSDRLAAAYDVLAEVLGKDLARVLTDRYRFSASPAEYVLMKFKELEKRLQEAGVSIDEFGAFLFLRRVALEKYRWDEAEGTWVHDPEAGTAGRATVSNPLGVDQQSAKAASEYIYERWNEQQRRAVDEVIAEMLAINEEVTNALESIEMLDEKGIEFLRANQFYASFVPAERFPSWVAATVKRQVGTDLSIVNPFWATGVKFAALLSFAQRHATVQAAVDAAAALGIARPRETVEGALAEGLGVVNIYRAGKKVPYVVPQGLAMAFQASPIYQGLAGDAIKLVNSFIQGVLVRYNPRFLGFNVPRDLRQSLMQLQEVRSPLDVAQYLKVWASAVKEAWRLLRRGELGPMTEEALRESAVTIGYLGNFDEAAMMADISSAFAEALEKARMAEALEKAGRKSTLAELAKAGLGKAVSPLRAVAKFLEDIGATQEMATKVAGYHFLLSKGVRPAEAADKARNLVGTPNYRRAGRLAPIIQLLFPFTNVRKEGYRALFLAAKGDPLVFAAKMAFLSVIPTALRWSIKTGLLWALYNAFAPKTGNDEDDREERKAIAWLTEVFRRAIPGDIVNYDVIPLALRRDGKAVYLRIPVDYDVQVMNNLVWTALESATGRGEPAGFIADALAFVSGETPNLNPLFGFAVDVSLASLGLNPPDTYRRMPKVPPNIFAARDWRTYAVLAKQDLVGLLGGYGFAVKPQWEAEALTPAERVLLDNPVSRTLASWFVRRTDFGLRAEEKRLEELARVEAARRALDLNEVVADVIAKGGTFADATKEASRRGLVPKSPGERAKVMRSLLRIWKQARRQAIGPESLPRGLPREARQKILDLRRLNEEMLAEALGEGED